MREFTWSNYYQIGNQKVDLQHQELFNLANQLVQSRNQIDLAENATRLKQHVEEHFQTEEVFMKTHGYPSYQLHIQKHQAMLDKLAAVNLKIQNHDWQQMDILDFMHEWISHILGEDVLIKAYFSGYTEGPEILEK